MKRLVLFAALFCIAATAWAGALPHESDVPGGIAVVPLPQQMSKARYNGHPILVIPHNNKNFAIVGLSLNTTPGTHKLTAIGTDKKQPVSFKVHAKHYATQRITIKDKSLVTLSAADLKRVHRESKIIDAVYGSFKPQFHAKFPFALPVKGIESSPFGVRRIINGKPRSPHSGIDIAAPAGTPVRAPAAGIVAVIGDFFFNGNTVIINHGRGLVSVYVHLSKIKVHEGEHVKRGQVIAEVGSTGRTTGADLHWTVNLNGTHINPELLLSKAELKSIQ